MTLAALEFGFCLAARPGSMQLSVTLVWVGVAIIGILLATAVLYYLKKMALSREGRTRPELPAEDVEKLRSGGLLSEAEYKRARRAALGLSSKPDPASGPADADDPGGQDEAGPAESGPVESDDCQS